MNNINLNELTLDNIGQWPAPVKYLLAAIVAILIVALGYWVIVKPNIEQYDALLVQEETLRAEFEQKQQMASNLQAYRVQLQIIKERFGNMLRQLPAQNEMPGLVEDISKTGIASGLTFELFAPQPEVAHDFYIELPINITVVGNYHQLALFLSRIAQMSRIVTLHDFEISSAFEDESQTRGDKKIKNKPDLLRMKITAKIYRYRTL
ncbi:type IV pilus inner membrane component PilO [Legionella spiritensis]|uniref:Type IV pilus biogenesis protein PilO n=1 Tax=Legionella spiritensis TaxID=452 RepID=A0A0W0Z7P1_LEGSP|nr:type 4a pilus biogenesis protein PilO [Legionella spiritensis]KTD64883.1 type IV pilus biogenesis protein PilO [Legionella spiritensis]SNV41106.1 type IV pilus biogenesis protein PilO [Legionella spiritensis]